MRRSWRLSATGWLIAGIYWAAGASAWAQYGAPYCQILDAYDDPIWQVHLHVMEDARIDGFGSFGRTRLQARAPLLYFHARAGELDVAADLDLSMLTRRGGLQLPEQVGTLQLDIEYAIRLTDGYALRLGFAPGLFSEWTHIKRDHFHYPFRAHGLYAATPNLSLLFGLNFFPGFERLLDLEVGARWAISDFLLFDLFYPQSEVVFRPNVWWAIRMGVEMSMISEYALKASDDRERMMLRETRFYAGVDRLITEQLQIMIRVGRLVDRSVDFKFFEPKSRIDDSLYLQVGIGGLI